MKASTNTRRIVGGIIIFIAAILLGIYIAVAFYFNDKFMPETVINNEDFGKAQKVEVISQLETQLQHYALDVLGRDLQTGEETTLFEITTTDIDLVAVVEEKEIEQILKQQNSWLWPVLIWQSFEYSVQGDISYNVEKLADFLDNQEAFLDKCTSLPQDAYIKGYSEESGKYVIEPEVQGNRLNIELAKQEIEAAIAMNAERISLEESNCYLVPGVLTSDEALQQNVDQANKWIDTNITYNWNTRKVELTGEQIKEWIHLQDGMLTLDETAVAEFVEQNASQWDTYGKNRVFRTTLGYDLTLPSGAFGWLTDREAETENLLVLINEGSVCDRTPVYACKAPWKGTNDIGNSYVEVDMTHQHLYLYQNGVLVLETDFVSGDMSKNYNTPEGVFGITYKTTNAILRGGDYAEQVSYWMPYHGNYGMHDATWREEFGGDIYLTNGSHGCINLPLDKAGEIYRQVSEGFPVICYYYPPGVLPEV